MHEDINGIGSHQQNRSEPPRISLAIVVLEAAERIGRALRMIVSRGVVYEPRLGEVGISR